MDAPEASLLVVDDEPNIRELLSASLRFVGFKVASAATGADALAAVARERPDLVVLDVMLPDMTGFAVVQRLREESGPRPLPGAPDRLPVLFLTAKDGVEDKISGLTAGGDDYVTKPFSLEELIARIRAILRRTGGPTGDGRLVAGDLELDPVGHQVLRAGRPVSLSPTEFKLLAYLMANADRVVSKLQILDHVWAYDFGGDLSIVESYISYVRRKVDSGADGTAKLIHTVRGVGYVLRRPPLPAQA
ncbi:response regulator transcription factor [Actinacidiphila guanduensis]|jgi:two-component system OmpR family response regulator|uniref:Two-component system, OmpR family, response regulator n=1 Tax=Actinacidiphila guanduensis TaxID=310781 RepID=A0A1G9XAC4_9ACTN|nr:response regulator transcription factor [Actinacidiphila guanduensis]SDM93293.1 two-component system, OmpR family, response regulator [Actinacidiphila guanduensis]